jgi:nucleotide-binding universal stress UspA family protein
MKKILIPHDFTEHSETTLNYGIELAKEIHAEIILLNVISYPIVTSETGMPAFSYKDVIADSLKDLRKLAEKIQLRESSLEKINCFAEMGDTSQIIVEYCEKHPVEFVLMGVYQHSNKLMQVLMGSNAIETSHRTKCTVIVVPPGTVYKKPAVIAFANDQITDTANPGLDKAKAITHLFNANLEILKVVGKGHHFAPGEVVVNNYFENKSEKQPHKLVLISEKKVSEELLGMLGNNMIDMMIMEPHEHSLFYNLFHESVSKEVVYASPVPVILMHS